MLLYNNDDDCDATFTSSITLKIGFTAVTFTNAIQSYVC